MTGRDNVRSVADSAGGEWIAFEEFRRADTEQSVPDRFEQQVRRFPDRLAVKSQTQALTYAALNIAANRLAHAIVERRGVGQEPVALLVAWRSCSMSRSRCARSSKPPRSPSWPCTFSRARSSSSVPTRSPACSLAWRGTRTRKH